MIKSGVEVLKGVFRFFLILILKSKSSLLNASPSYLSQRLKIFTFTLTFQKINQTLAPLNIPSQSTSEIKDLRFRPSKPLPHHTTTTKSPKTLKSGAVLPTFKDFHLFSHFTQTPTPYNIPSQNHI